MATATIEERRINKQTNNNFLTRGILIIKKNAGIYHKSAKKKHKTTPDQQFLL
jgi:hypothetical protein